MSREHLDPTGGATRDDAAGGATRDDPGEQAPGVDPDAATTPDPPTVTGTRGAATQAPTEAPTEAPTDGAAARPASTPAVPRATTPAGPTVGPDPSAQDTDHEQPTGPDAPDRPAAAALPEQPSADDSAGQGRVRPWWRELLIILVTALVLSVIVKGFVVQSFFIPSGSMELTLHGCPGCGGDRVLVNKFVYRTRSVRRGEVVVFRGTPSWPAESVSSGGASPLVAVLDGLGRLVGAAPTGDDFIKRVIAIPGDTVRCCDARGRVTVNGHALDEPYVYQDNHRVFGPVRLGPGQLWVMGDHRGDSSDSRDNGPIPADHVVGRAFAVIWPVSRWRSLPVPATFDQAGLTGALAGQPDPRPA